jgi:hypothetical protein
MICSDMLDRTSAPTPPADAAPEDHFAWAQALLIRQVMRLEALSESALRMAQAIERQATGEPSGLAEVASATAGAEAPGPPPPSLDAAALAFSRVARGMHTTALLQSRLIGELEQGRGREEARAEDARKARIAERLKDPDWEHKMRVEGIVARVAEPKLGGDDEALYRLMAEVHDRLDDDDIYGDVVTRPVGELVALVCRDLGLEPDWPTLAREAWAQEEMESGVENSPFQDLELARPPSCAAANGGGGPSADPGFKPGEEPMVVGAGQAHPPLDSSA